MQALFSAALEKRVQTNIHDKFLILSHNSVPVKPFSAVRNVLIAGTSSFVQPVPSNKNKNCGKKTSQWIILNPDHAQAYVDDDAHLHYWEWDDICAEPRGCLDEYYTLATIFGKRGLAWRGRLNDLKEEHNVEFRDIMYIDFSQDHMGAHALEEANLLSNISSYPNFVAELSISGTSQGTNSMGPLGPAEIDKVSAKALTKFRESDYLFFRKIEDPGFATFKSDHETLSLPDAFQKYVFDVAD
eukprot:CAMPEP_0180472272 /NCGR_PEP_ID=MMETSP1036_2-20121128/29553_1 /TAXON_ID=632150 /ORGANISM="Azadinium spinosum, Strain 3D9" /LENGTH=242 /DNA_ID=CAMNT_0022479507 /DNA_START=455 /DNA_END=1180 /DNA_ORIENTATION=-